MVQVLDNQTNPDDAEKQQAPQQGVVQFSPSSGIIGGPGAGHPAQATAPNTGGQFATLQSYLSANQTQAQPLTNQLLGGVSQQQQTAQESANKTIADVGQQVQSGYTPLNQNVIDQAAANPVSFTQTPSNVQAFQGQLTDQYKGPSSFESTAPFQSTLAALQQQQVTGNQMTGTEAGRQQMLQDTEKNKAPGITALNSAILSQNPQAQAQLQGAYKPWTDIIGGLQNADINKQITAAQAQTQQAQQGATNTITQGVSGLNTAVQNELAKAQANSKALSDKITKDLAAGQAGNIANDLALAGVPQDKIDAITANLGILSKDYQQNPNLANYFSFSPSSITQSNIATPEEYQQAAAFQQLAGNAIPNVGNVLNPGDASQAGTAPNAASGINFQNIGSYLSGNIAGLDKDIASGVNLTPDLNSIGGTDVNKGTQLGQRYADAIGRLGLKPLDDKGFPTPIAQLFHDADVYFVRSLGGDQFGGGQMSPNDPRVAGLKAFVNILGKALYGSGYYPVGS